jgi:DNA-binding CsgD family transcriptional regulator
LDNYTENLIGKSKAIEELNIEIEKLKGLKSTEIYNKKIDNLDDLTNSTILTNDDWEKFKDLFEQVYKGFFTKLRDKYANLSKAEIRLISLMKLNLDTKQMANMLGVSPSTITMTKYRLRKKINLTEKEDIDLIIQSL